MDLYLTSLAVGGVGLAVMAASGFMHHGHAGDGGHGPHSEHGGHGGHAAHHGDAHAGHGHEGEHSAGQALLALMSPRVLFSVALGLGTAGVVLRGFLTEPLLIAAALTSGIAFERLLVRPIWNFLFRFESRPALTLESATGGDATAVSAFDANGQGLIALEVDGQMVQLLGTLRASDRELRVPVRVGTRLRVEEVDAARHRCTVSVV